MPFAKNCDHSNASRRDEPPRIPLGTPVDRPRDASLGVVRHLLIIATELSAWLLFTCLIMPAVAAEVQSRSQAIPGLLGNRLGTDGGSFWGDVLPFVFVIVAMAMATLVLFRSGGPFGDGLAGGSGADADGDRVR